MEIILTCSVRERMLVYHCTSFRMASIFVSKAEITNVGEGEEKWEPLYIAGKLGQSLWNCVVNPNRLNMELLCDPATPLLCLYAPDWKQGHKQIIVHQNSITHISQKVNTTQVSIFRWMDTHTMEYYWALVRNEIWYMLQCIWTLKTLC